MFNEDKYFELKSLCQAKDCALVLVSKNASVADIQEAYDTGHRDFGESYVQEMLEKQGQLSDDIQWHMVGHLQTNKTRAIAPFVHTVHSVDSYKVLKEVDKFAKEYERTIDCLLQVKIGKEEDKFGFDPEDLPMLLRGDNFKRLTSVRVLGLMGIATNTDESRITGEDGKHGLVSYLFT